MQDKTRAEVRTILHDFAIDYDVSSRESRNRDIDKALTAIETLLEKDKMSIEDIADIIYCELPVNYDGTDPATVKYELEKVAKALHAKL